MPEISSTMYPIIIAGAGAIVVLLLLFVVVRRRQAGRDESTDEHDTGSPGTEDESLGVKLIESDDDAQPEDDEARGRVKENGRVADGAEASPPETSGSQGAETKSKTGSLVAWGPDETGPERPRAEAEPQTETDTGAPREAESANPPAALHSPADTPPAESPFGVEPEGGPETPPLKQHSPAEAAPPSAAGPEEESAGPEGQPFERDGRWWFRRDGELLVYDDATSEWKAAPQTESPPLDTGGPASAAKVDGGAHGEALQGTSTTATIEREAPDPHQGALRPRSEGATFWKCGTCGATNGSAAESCRMCFAARP